MGTAGEVFTAQRIFHARRSARALTCRRVGLAACMTMVLVGWSQLPLRCSSIIILDTTLCTCAHMVPSDTSHHATSHSWHNAWT